MALKTYLGLKCPIYNYQTSTGIELRFLLPLLLLRHTFDHTKKNAITWIFFKPGPPDFAWQ